MRPFTLPIAGLAVMQGCGGSDSPPASEPQKKNIPMFVERATESGLVFQHRSGASGQYYLPESLGAGCGLFDADGDGDLDALFVRGHNLEELADAESQNRFFRNTGEGQFVNDTTNAGLTDLGYSYGVTCGDVDADGDIDLYITNFGKDCLYYNDGTGRFTKAPEADSAALDDFSVSSCFLDYDRDGDLDLFVTRYLDWSVDIGGGCFNLRGGRDYCNPQRYGRALSDRLLQNNGQGQFTDVSETSGISEFKGNGLAVGSTDLNGDGWPDVYVANDKTANALWINNQDGTFTESAGRLGCATGLDGTNRAGMSVAFCDLDQDGDFEIHVSNIEGEADGLFQNQNGRFLDRAAGWGIAGASRRYTRWASRFLDINADGRDELVVACGKVLRDINPPREDVPYAEKNLVYQEQTNGRFTPLEDVFDPEVPVEASHGVAHGDVNGDGRVDLIMVSRDGPAQMWLSNPELEQPPATRINVETIHGTPAVGSRMKIVKSNGTAQTYHIDVSSGYASTSSHVVWTSGEIERIEVQWVGGHSSTHTGPWESGSGIVITESEGHSVAQQPTIPTKNQSE